MAGANRTRHLQVPVRPPPGPDDGHDHRHALTPRPARPAPLHTTRPLSKEKLGGLCGFSASVSRVGCLRNYSKGIYVWMMKARFAGLYAARYCVPPIAEEEGDQDGRASKPV